MLIKGTVCFFCVRKVGLISVRRIALKKYWKFIVSSLLLMLLSLPGVNAFASADGGNGGWNSTFRVYSPDDNSGFLTKNTSSSIYNSTSFVSASTLWFMGWAAVQQQHGPVDASHGYHYQFYTGTSTYMYNYVVEDYGAGTSTTVYMRSFSNGNANGQWQPDI